MQLLIAFAFVLVTTHAFSPRLKDTRITSRIINGQNAYNDQFPYMVEIVIPPTDVCGGSLIGSSWILTAAHCVDGSSSVQVYLGSVLADDGEVSYTVEAADIIIHPTWHTPNRADIALLRIPETELCDGIGIVALPKFSYSYSSYAGEQALMSGWGVMVEEPITFPDVLQWAPMRIMSNEECSNMVFGLQPFDLCVDTSNLVSPCGGDSGSPLVLQNGEQVGVFISGSPINCHSGEPAIFERVTSFLDWIETVTGISY